MDENLSKLKEQISKIDTLRGIENWGPEYQIWEQSTEKLVRQIFGGDGLNLFKQQRTMTTSYIDPSFNRSQYLKELDNRKRILNGLLSEVKESLPIVVSSEKTDKSVLKEIWAKETAIKENLLTTSEVQVLHEGLIEHLKVTLSPDSLPGLRFRKLQTVRQIWWSTEDGYPYPAAWPSFQPYLDLLSQHEAEKTIKKRLETEGLFVESRSQGEDQHLLIGKRDGTSEKAHLIIDGKTGEIRVEDNRQEPTELLARIETILTLPNGKQIKTTREAIEEISEK
jgi:hypothetical protein